MTVIVTFVVDKDMMSNKAQMMFRLSNKEELTVENFPIRMVIGQTKNVICFKPLSEESLSQFTQCSGNRWKRMGRGTRGVYTSVYKET